MVLGHGLDALEMGFTNTRTLETGDAIKNLNKILWDYVHLILRTSALQISFLCLYDILFYISQPN